MTQEKDEFVYILFITVNESKEKHSEFQQQKCKFWDYITEAQKPIFI